MKVGPPLTKLSGSTHVGNSLKHNAFSLTKSLYSISFIYIQLHGHRNISVLDGGFWKWENSSYEVTADVPAPLVRINPFNPLCIIDFLRFMING